MIKSLISRNTSTSLKGILCIFVLLHHLLNFENSYINSILNILGPLAVGGFFLLSGYGLIVNYIKYGKIYLKKLACKRIPITYIILIITNIFYLILYLTTQSTSLSVANIFASIFYISFSKSFIPLYSWIYFISDLLIYYIVFLILFVIIEYCKFIKQKTKFGAIIHFTIVLLIYITISLISHKLLGQRAIFCFSLGILSGAFENKLSIIFAKYRFILCTLLILMIAALFNFCNTTIVKEQILPLFFCLFILVAFAQIDFGFKPFLLFGKISLYIYLTHGLFYKLFEYYFVFPSYLTFILVTICSVIISSILYITKYYIIKKFKKRV